MKLECDKEERAVLGSCLLEGHIPPVAQALRPEDFGAVAHGLIFRAMLEVAATGIRVDGLTVSERLKVLGSLQPAGGPAYLMGLDQSVPTVANLSAYVSTVKDRAFRRTLKARARALDEAANNLAMRPAFAAQEASATLADLALSGGDDRDEMGDVDVAELNDRWDAYARGEFSPFLGTGLEALAEIFRGFLCNLNLVGGKASMGKTAFVAQMVWGWLKRGIPGGIFGLEDGTGWLVERHCARALSIDLGDVAACRLNAWQEESYQQFMADAHGMLGRLLRVHRTSGLEAPDLLRKARRWIANGAKWIVIDHGGRIGHQSKSERESENLKIKATVQALDDLAHNASVPIIVNWHFNRDGGKREGRPTMEDYRESGYLEAFSGTMLGLWERDNNPGMLLCTVVKNRKGPRDVTVALERDARCGLVKPSGGYAIDHAAEREQERAERQSSRKKVNLFGGGR